MFGLTTFDFVRLSSGLFEYFFVYLQPFGRKLVSIEAK